MFILNETRVDPNRGRAALRQFYADASSHRYALHLTDTAELLRHILFLRDMNAGVFPIHPDIPASTAHDMAVTAGCDRIVTAEGLTNLPQTSPIGRGGVLVQMSSGTTGAPKVITRTWAQISVEVASYAVSFKEAQAMTPVIACPVSHSYGLIAGVLVALHRGHTPVVIDTLNPKFILRRLREVTRPLLYTSPAMLHTLAQLLPAEETLYAAMTSGTVLPEPWFVCIRARTTHLFQQYGCSEAGCIAINPDLRQAADIGYPLPHLEVDTGGTAQAPQMIHVRADGSEIRTGDLGYRRPDGMLVFAARQDDVIDVAGLNVYPQDVEQAALAQPGVEDALAFGIDDPMAGGRVALLIAGAGADPAAIRKGLQTRLAPYQQPGVIEQVGTLPRQANGKISRREVAKHFARQGVQAEMRA
ncbi:acyl-CoA synthetase [Roseobacter cerasinus]|uniref:Acyl-CoA synthetase n=1 Tax=Roseobacter cerasinus TaxID=2602289 RepID=A0A640VU05_9RHOB|nr:AMP-binding protein [Roseobacter cerasinus]GFE51074.1 acyl-CoA synthetase [Roseobacter cerasinus]